MRCKMNVENKQDIKDIVLSVLFVAGEGIEKSFMSEKLNLTEKELDKIIEDLKKDYCEKKGIHVITYKNKVQLASNPAYAEYISEVLNPIREKTLTRAALETCAIIAYKQPITKLEIEEIRGVNNGDYAIQILLDQNMIEVVGRKDAVGKPLLFGTTDNFLKRFNLQDLAELPDYDGLLERIRVIESGEAEQKSDSLYNEFSLPEEEEIPDFLKDVDGVETIKGTNEIA